MLVIKEVVFKHFYLINFIVWSNLKRDALKNYLGFVWWFLDPLLYCGVFYLVFNNFRKNDENFVVYLLVGITCWRWVSGSIINSSRSYVRSKTLLTNFVVSPLIFPLAAICEELLRYLIIFSVLLLALIYTNQSSLASFQSFLTWFITSIIIILSWSILLSVILPFLPDLAKVIPSAFMLLLFLSGVIFPIETSSEMVLMFVNANPFLYVISGVRDCMLDGGLSNYEEFKLLFLIHFVMLIFCITISVKFQKHIVRRFFE